MNCPGPSRPRHILTLSAETQEALREWAGCHASFLAKEPGLCLADLCYSVNTGRANHAHRLAVVSPENGPAEAVRGICEDLTAFADGADPAGVQAGEVAETVPPKVAFLFTGQGAQFAGMGRQLYDTEPVFRETIDRCHEVFVGETGDSLLSAVFPEDGDETRLRQTAFTQPALFALECALARMWEAWGVRPDVVLGHSVGELAAACVAGAFTLEDGMRLITERGRLIQSLPADGAMAAVFADWDTVAAVVEPRDGDLDIATVNGPKLHVLSGRAGAVDAALEVLAAQKVRAQRLAVSHAFHSPLMDPILDPFTEVIRDIPFLPLEIPLASNRDGRLVKPGETLGTAYWRAHLREPVWFCAGMETLVREGCGIFLEIGPANTLIGMGRRCIGRKEGLWLSSLDKSEDNWGAVLDSLGALFVAGASIDWEAFDRPYERKRLVFGKPAADAPKQWFGPGAPAVHTVLPDETRVREGRL